MTKFGGGGGGSWPGGMNEGLNKVFFFSFNKTGFTFFIRII